MIYIASNITVLREQKKLSTGQLSELTGITIDHLLLCESGNIEPDLNEVVKLADVLNVPVAKLLTHDYSLLAGKLKDFSFKFLALDIDGVLTDAGMYYTESGDEFKKFNAKDGLAIKTLTAAGFQVGFVSSGINSTIIENRAALLGVQKIYVGTWKKAEIIEQWCKELNIGFENIAYIGDDTNDLPAIAKCGFTACPADAADAVKQQVDIILSLKGGDGCVREFVEKYIMEIK
jgi:3-deoxy-D-manno-octulosonate 8-phosphate phosphatase (KDO 8-P phosphatase)